MRYVNYLPPCVTRGFTLTEFMLVVVLIGLLSAVAMPFYKGYQQRVRVHQAVLDITAMSAVASNYDFDLYSLGADGQSKLQITQSVSVDDVIRASNGTSIGLASAF